MTRTGREETPDKGTVWQWTNIYSDSIEFYVYRSMAGEILREPKVEMENKRSRFAHCRNFRLAYMSSVHAESIAILEGFTWRCISIRARSYFRERTEILRRNAAEPLVNLGLSPLSPSCFMRAGHRGGFSWRTQLNAFDACFSERAARLSATARYE